MATNQARPRPVKPTSPPKVWRSGLSTDQDRHCEHVLLFFGARLWVMLAVLLWMRFSALSASCFNACEQCEQHDASWHAMLVTPSKVARS